MKTNRKRPSQKEIALKIIDAKEKERKSSIYLVGHSFRQNSSLTFINGRCYNSCI